jgi:D-3-phosphoglycerate dehydrogenase
MTNFLVNTSAFDVTDNPYFSALLDLGLTPILNPYGRKLSEAELLELITPQTIGIIAGVEPLTETVMAAAPNLKVISRVGTGMDSVDQKAAARANIAVFRTAEAPASAVCELTLGMMLCLLRKVAESDRALRRGEWQSFKGELLQGKTVGIVGCGVIGRKLTAVLRALDAEVVGFDPYVEEDAIEGIELVRLDRLFELSHIVTLHVPGGLETHHMIDDDAISKMRDGAFLINASRGGVVDEDALASALKTGKLAGAALDVFEQEPYEGPLTDIDNLLMTAHLGSRTKETRRMMEHDATANLLTGLRASGFYTD